MRFGVWVTFGIVGCLGVEVDAGVEVDGGPVTVPIVFFYQDVAPTGNRVRVGYSSDGVTVRSFDVDAAAWTVFGATYVFGDPTWTRYSDGRWAMVANTSPGDPRGAMALLYHEAACPRDAPPPAEVPAITAVSAQGCKAMPQTAMAKSSQPFEAHGARWLFVGNDGGVWLVRLANEAGERAAGICFRRDGVTTLDGLAVGDAVEVLVRGVEGPIGDDGVSTGPLLLSDAAIARRLDGTWVLFVKGVSAALGCSGGGLCELCARGIYRSTSPDLLRWSALERVAYRASVPDATTDVDGIVRLVWQDFSAACDASDLQLAARAPISSAVEDADGAMSARTPLAFADESFETDARLHYPTNGNPVVLPDLAAWAELEACMKP